MGVSSDDTLSPKIPPDCWQTNYHRPESMVRNVYRRMLVYTDYAQKAAVCWHVIHKPFEVEIQFIRRLSSQIGVLSIWQLK